MDDVRTRRAALGLRHSRRASWLFLVAVGGYLLLPVPWVALSAAPALGSLVHQAQAYRAFSVLHRAGGLRTMSALAMVACGAVATLAVAPAVESYVRPGYHRCMAGANTHTARQECRDRFGTPLWEPFLAR